MVQSLGISVGNKNSYIAGGQGGGIEILLNEYSNRSTPSMVAFTDYCRSIGDEASNNLFMNIKNTIYDLMVLLGKPFKEIDTSVYPFRIEEAKEGSLDAKQLGPPQVVIRHLNEENRFTITQVLAMLFTKLRGIASDATDCVISCPQFFNDTQKNALIQAAIIAGLNPLQVISDMSAVVLNYAYFRTTRKDPHRFVAFINLGQSNLQCCVALLTPKEDTVRILATESEPIGGRDFDKLLADHFIKQNGLNLNPKSRLKLIAACEKVKKLLSANPNDIPVHVESLISEDKDFTARIDRATFEELIQDLLNKIENCLKRTLDSARANFSKFLLEEKERIQEEKKKKKMQEEKKKKILEEKKKVQEEANAKKEEEKTQGGETIQNDEKMQEGDNIQVDEKPQEEEKMQVEENTQVEEKILEEELKFDLQIVELVGGSTRIPAIKQLAQNVFNISPSTTLNTDEAVVRGCVLHCATLHPGMKVKREVKILGSESFFKSTGLTCDKELRRIELELIVSDKKYKSRTEARNNLEEYIYSERSKLQQGDQLMNRLAELLDWLGSDEGEYAPEEEYNSKLEELKEASKARSAESNK